MVSGEVIEPETGMLRQAKTITTTTVAEEAEEIPVVEEVKPVEKEESPVPIQVAELKFIRPLQPALQPNEERVLE